MGHSLPSYRVVERGWNILFPLTAWRRGDGTFSSFLQSGGEGMKLSVPSYRVEEKG
jgi:hypothetical protein